MKKVNSPGYNYMFDEKNGNFIGMMKVVLNIAEAVNIIK